MSSAWRRSVLLLGALGLLSSDLRAQAGPEMPPPLSREECEAFLAEWSHAHRRESQEALAKLVDPSLHPQMLGHVRWLFNVHNYIRLEHEILSYDPVPDGAEVALVTILRSRHVQQPHDSRDKTAWRCRLERRPTGVQLTSFEPVPVPRPDVPPWRPEDWKVVVAVHPKPTPRFGSPEGTVDIQTTVRLRLPSKAEPRSVVAFSLDPFADELEAEIGGQLVPVVRHHGGRDLWQVELPAAIEPGEAVEVSMTYSLHSLGASDDFALGEPGGHLFEQGAWLPVFGRRHHADPARASHDIVIDVPSDWSGVAPGVAAGVEEKDGRKRYRWFSRFEAGGLAVVVGPLKHREVKVEGVTLDLHFREQSQKLSEEFVEEFARLMKPAVELLGPCPSSRFTVVEQLGSKQRGGAAFLAIDSDFLQKDLRGDASEREPALYLAHRLAHLWVIDALPSEDPAMKVMAEALCDHMATAWVAEAITPELATKHRANLMAPLVHFIGSDKPLSDAFPGMPDEGLLGRGKGQLVLDGYRVRAGEEHWRATMRTFFEKHRSTGARFGDLLGTLSGDDPGLSAYVGSWFLSSGFTDVRVETVTTTERPDGKHDNAVVVFNEGQGPIRCVVEVRARGSEPRYFLDLEAGETKTLSFESDGPLLQVQLDPDRTLWQADTEDDDWPEDARTVRDPKLRGRQKIDDETTQELKALLGG